MASNQNRPLRVLHLPVNIRWVMDATIQAEEEIGIETKTMLISRAGLDEGREARVDYIPYNSGAKKFSVAYLKYLFSILRYFGHYAQLLKWADVIHWQYSNRLWLGAGKLKNLDFFLLRLFNKPAIVQFHGGDFRNSEEWAKTNRWWREAYEPNFVKELDEKARITQDSFAKAGFIFALGYGMYPFVKPENKDRAIILERSIVLEKPKLSHAKQGKIKIMHAPSHPTAKGTKYITKAIESLKNKYDIDFVLIQNMSHDFVIKNLEEADIVVDQLLCGDYGLFAVEAMNAGAAVVANVNKQLRSEYPSSLPIVQAEPDTIYEVLEDLICDREKRMALSAQGPVYAQLVHSHRSVLPHVLNAYRYAAEKKNDSRTMKKIDRHLKQLKNQGE